MKTIPDCFLWLKFIFLHISIVQHVISFPGKPDKFVVDNTNDIKQHDRDWEEIGEFGLRIFLNFVYLTFCFLAAERVKSLSKKDTAPRGKKDDIKDFDQ